MTNLDSILNSRDVTLPTKVHLVKAMSFPVVMYGCESWTTKKAEHRRSNGFEPLLGWRRLLRVCWTVRRSNESTPCMKWQKYWSFSFSIIPSKEIPGLISFRMDWLDLLVVQGTLKSLLQHHSSKASILQHSAFFTVQLSHPYMPTGKTPRFQIQLDKWPLSPGTPREASGVPCLNPRQGLTLLSPVQFRT